MAERIGLWLFHGGEAYLVERAFQDTWASLTSGLESELDRELLDSSVSAEELVTAAGSVGFFSSARVVGVRGWKALVPASGKRKPDMAGAERAAELFGSLPPGANVVLSAPVAVPGPTRCCAWRGSGAQPRSFPSCGSATSIAGSSGGPGSSGSRPGRAHSRRWPSPQATTCAYSTVSCRSSTSTRGWHVGSEDVRALVPDTAEHQVWDLTDPLPYWSTPGAPLLSWSELLPQTNRRAGSATC